MDINIRIAGAAGQGIQTAADLLGKAITRGGWRVSSFSDAESRIRGGLNFTHLRVSELPGTGVTNRVDILVALSYDAVGKLAPDLTERGVVVATRIGNTPDVRRCQL